MPTLKSWPARVFPQACGQGGESFTRTEPTRRVLVLRPCCRHLYDVPSPPGHGAGSCCPRVNVFSCSPSLRASVAHLRRDIRHHILPNKAQGKSVAAWQPHHLAAVLIMAPPRSSSRPDPETASDPRHSSLSRDSFAPHSPSFPAARGASYPQHLLDPAFDGTAQDLDLLGASSSLEFNYDLDPSQADQPCHSPPSEQDMR